MKIELFRVLDKSDTFGDECGFVAEINIPSVPRVGEMLFLESDETFRVTDVCYCLDEDNNFESAQLTVVKE